MNYPTAEQVAAADRVQLGTWYRFLPSPNNDAEIDIMTKIFDRFKAMGMFTPEISKIVGWRPR
jgi:hypothetical protein